MPLTNKSEHIQYTHMKHSRNNAKKAREMQKQQENRIHSQTQQNRYKQTTRPSLPKKTINSLTGKDNANHMTAMGAKKTENRTNTPDRRYSSNGRNGIAYLENTFYLGSALQGCFDILDIQGETKRSRKYNIKKNSTGRLQ